MRQSSGTVALSAARIEHIHDVGIEYVWPGIEPVEAGTCIQQNLLLSAERQPYQECFGQELYPTLLAKAAYLFYHLTTSHIFENGNKRTACICLDTFLLLNGVYLLLTNGQLHDLAQDVASAGERGVRYEEAVRQIGDLLTANTLSLGDVKAQDAETHERLERERERLLSSPLGELGTPLRQSFR